MYSDYILPQKAIDEYKELVYKDRKVKLTDAQAREEAQNFFNLMKLIMEK